MIATNLFYFLTVTMAVFFAYLAKPSNNSKLNYLWFCLSFIVLFFVLGFRNASGTDDPAYTEIFYEVGQMGVWDYWRSMYLEPGYLAINVLVGYFTENFLVLQAIVAFIPLLIFYKGFAKYQNYISIPFAVLLLCSFYYFQMLSASLIRMFIAISILYCYSFDYLFRRLTKKYIITLFVAALFHYSVLVMLLFVPLTFSDKTLKKHWKLLTIILGTVVIIMLNFMTDLASALGGRYAGYGENEENEAKGFLLNTLDTLPFVFLAFYYKKIVPEYMSSIFIRAFIILIFSVIFAFYGGVFGRVIFYMNLSLLFILPGIFRITINKLFFAILIIIYAILYMYVTQFNNAFNSEYLYPYENIFFTI